MTKLLKNADVTGYISQTLVTSSLLKTDSAGKLVAAVAGTDYNAPNVTAVAGTLIREIRNTTGATLTKGTVVYISGATGNKATVSKAIATGDSTSAQTFGLCQTDIANNSNGYVVCAGDITGLDTSAFSEGVQLYLSSTTAGTYTSTKQYAPAHLVYVGVVTRQHTTQGQIEVKIQNGYEMDELHNVSAQSPSNNDGIFYNTSTSLWEKKSIATVLGFTPEQPITFSSPLSRSTNTVSIPAASSSANGYLSSTDWSTFNGKQNALTNPVTGTGTTSYLPKFTGTSALGNSLIYDTGSVILIGATTALDNQSKLELVSGGTIGLKIKSSGANGNNTFLSIEASKDWRFLTNRGDLISGNQGDLIIRNNTDAINHIILNQNGSTRFYSSVTAGSFVKSGGLATEILAADGTVITAGTNITISDGTISASGGGSAPVRAEQTVTATAGTNTITVTSGYTVGLIDVYVNGVKYPPSDYTATTSPTVVIAGLVAGDIISIITYISEITVLPTSRDVIEYTATSGQVDFTVSGGYTIGLLDVYVNGTKLTSSEYSMPDTTKFTLAIASVTGDQVQAIRYNSSVTGVSGSGTTNYVPKFTASGTIGNSLLYSSSTGVGIGTTSPGEKFWINLATNVNFAVGGTTRTRLLGVNDANNNFCDLSVEASNVSFYSAGVERMKVNSGGDVKFALNATFGTTSEMYIGRGNAISGAYQSYDFAITNFQASGRVVITASTSGSSGMYLAQGANSWTAWSDERMKTDLVPIDNAAEKVSQLRAMTGRYKNDDESVSRSFLIAQDVLSVLPEATNLDEATGMYGVQYTDIIPLLVASIKELKAEIDLLKNN